MPTINSGDTCNDPSDPSLSLLLFHWAMWVGWMDRPHIQCAVLTVYLLHTLV